MEALKSFGRKVFRWRTCRQGFLPLFIQASAGTLLRSVAKLARLIKRQRLFGNLVVITAVAADPAVSAEATARRPSACGGTGR